ncbi:hypothetical protein MHPYR_780013 [uncultured Mycobacterium sp.]|uniref:Uncharacterized protein n=1 Tax=uncultured Mycobacterium sp. TaxID=171292 RepID=A0A1Y5PPT4_9MYCO|nr:hypothetical protein MHPYR_780013 [uncultured Mycobacterium sp.]
MGGHGERWLRRVVTVGREECTGGTLPAAGANGQWFSANSQQPCPLAIPLCIRWLDG